MTAMTMVSVLATSADAGHPPRTVAATRAPTRVPILPSLLTVQFSLAHRPSLSQLAEAIPGSRSRRLPSRSVLLLPRLRHRRRRRLLPIPLTAALVPIILPRLVQISTLNKLASWLRQRVLLVGSTVSIRLVKRLLVVIGSMGRVSSRVVPTHGDK